MVVKDREASLKKADEISSKIIEIITRESKKFNCDDDPAEQIYLSIHIISSLMSKICFSLEGYGKIYDIQGLSYESLRKWIITIADEHIAMNKEDENAA